MKPIYGVLREALIERGWKIDDAAEENASGELREFLHPETGRAYAWLDALAEQQGLEIRRHNIAWTGRAKS